MSYRVLIIISLISLLTLSCEDNFNPFGDYKEKYILTCLLDGNSNYQVATLSKSYFTGTFNPYDNTTDPAIEGAEIRIWSGDSVYLMKDSTINLNDSSGNSSTFKFYYTEQVDPIQNKEMEIEALLSSGKRLKAKTITPIDISFKNGNPTVIPPVDENYLNFSWQSQSVYTFYDIRILVTYFKNENGFQKRYQKEIPIAYSIRGGSEVPIFPGASRNSNVSYPMEAITKFLQNISEGDENKSNYSIELKPLVEVLVMDEALSRYYSSTNAALNDLSVRLDENDYTNIEGGLGLFGSFFTKSYTSINFIATYIQSFGYNVIYN